MVKRHLISLILLVVCLNHVTSHAQSTLTLTGPWLVYHDNMFQYWAVNADGTAPTPITALSTIGGALWDQETSPHSNYSAYFIGSDWYLLHLPDLTVKRIRTNIEGHYITSAWSPNGELFAFEGKSKGGGSDIFLYSTKTDQVTQLTATNAQPDGLFWSPDGVSIVYSSRITSGYPSGTSAGRSSLWVANAANGKTNKLFEVNSYDVFDIDTDFLRWITPRTFTIAYTGLSCHDYEARTLDLDTLTMKVLYPAYFEDFAYAPTINKMLIAVSDEWSCSLNGTPQLRGIYLLTPENKPIARSNQPSDYPSVDWTTIRSTKIADYSTRNFYINSVVNIDTVRLVTWDATKGVFLFYQGENQISEITPDGKVNMLPPSPIPLDFIVSEDGQYAAGISGGALTIGHAPDFTFTQTAISSSTIQETSLDWVPQEQIR